MKLSVFGLGYVGCVSAACFADEGHEVIGVDVQPAQGRNHQQRSSPIVEPGMKTSSVQPSKKIGSALRRCCRCVVINSDVSLVCIGTPSNHNGALTSRTSRVCAGKLAKRWRG